MDTTLGKDRVHRVKISFRLFLRIIRREREKKSWREKKTLSSGGRDEWVIVVVLVVAREKETHSRTHLHTQKPIQSNPISSLQIFQTRRYHQRFVLRWTRLVLALGVCIYDYMVMTSWRIWIDESVFGCVVVLSTILGFFFCCC